MSFLCPRVAEALAEAQGRNPEPKKKMNLKSNIRIIAILTLVFLNVGCDQLSKKIVREKITANERIVVIKNNLILTNVENTGAAYSLGSDLSPLIKRILLQLIPAIVLIVMFLTIVFKTKYSKEMVIGFCFIIGGGIGNIFDRIVYGSVTDFMYIDLGFFNTEIFNMADVSIVVGALIVVVFSFIQKKDTISLEKKLG